MPKEYLISFIEEIIQNPKYIGWVSGRVEVSTNDSEYTIGEMRVFTKKVTEFLNFIDRYDLEYVDERRLNIIRRIIKSRFYDR